MNLFSNSLESILHNAKVIQAVAMATILAKYYSNLKRSSLLLCKTEDHLQNCYLHLLMPE